MSLDLQVDKPERLAERLALRLSAERRAAVAARGSCSLALPGGSVATTFFPRLASLDWSSCAFFWGDERAVPPDHPDSNYALAQRLWLGPAGVPPERVHRMPADAPDLEAAAAAHGAELERLLGTPPRLDVVLLGVGPDGHVGSLFPGHMALVEWHRPVVAILDAPKPPPRRLTLTLPVLASAGLLIVAALGGPKAAVVREALEAPDSRLPVALAARHAGRTLFLLDPDAASLLTPPSC